MRYVCICVFFVLLSAIKAQTCVSHSPIAKEYLGKVFGVADSCYRPNSSTSVVAYKSVLILEIGVGAPLTCNRKFVLHFRKPNQVPYVVEFPKMSYGGDFSKLNQNYEKVLRQWCSQNQKKIISWAKWSTRQKFISAVKTMANEMKYIRDYKCDVPEPLSENQKRTIQNSGVQFLLGYLYSVAYKYGFCI